MKGGGRERGGKGERGKDHKLEHEFQKKRRMFGGLGANYFFEQNKKKRRKML
jgi:hypothetical protein